jgi:predicted patatin/cPLA2 family phospholipase
MKQFTTGLVLAATTAHAEEVCRAVAFSSGDQTAAYQAGVLKAMAQASPDTTQYKAISGISGGAVSAGILASYAAGQEVEAADRIIKFWTDASNSDLYKDWLGGVTEGLLIKGGLYNNKNLNNFLEQELADIGAMQRYVNVGLADVLTGEWTDFDLTTDFLTIMEGSFSYAGFFPPLEAMETSWFDGSTIWDIDVFSAVNKCKEESSNVRVDVILTSEKHLKQVDPSNYKTLDMVWRFVHVMRYYNQMDGLLRAQFAYPDVEFCVISPEDPLNDGLYPLTFDTDDIHKMVS